MSLEVSSLVSVVVRALRLSVKDSSGREEDSGNQGGSCEGTVAGEGQEHFLLELRIAEYSFAGQYVDAAETHWVAISRLSGTRVLALTPFELAA